MMFVLTEWNACIGGLFDMLYVVWVGQTCMIWGHAPYEDRCAVLHLDTFSKRRSIACVMFIFDVLSGWVTSSSLLSVLDLITPRYPTRGTEFLRIDFHRTNYGIHEWVHWSVWFRVDPGSVFESSKWEMNMIFIENLYCLYESEKWTRMLLKIFFKTVLIRSFIEINIGPMIFLQFDLFWEFLYKFLF
jgi:hypothetical protein